MLQDRLWGTGVPLTQNDCLNRDNWISPGIMGKILEDIHMEFHNNFHFEQHSLNGVQSSLQNHLGPSPCQAPLPHSNTGSSTSVSPSPIVQPDPATLTTNEIPPLSSPINDNVIGPRQAKLPGGLTTPKQQIRSHPVTTIEANNHSVPTLWIIWRGSHSSEPTITV